MDVRRFSRGVRKDSPILSYSQTLSGKTKAIPAGWDGAFDVRYYLENEKQFIVEDVSMFCYVEKLATSIVQNMNDCHGAIKPSEEINDLRWDPVVTAPVSGSVVYDSIYKWVKTDGQVYKRPFGDTPTKYLEFSVQLRDSMLDQSVYAVGETIKPYLLVQYKLRFVE